MFLQILRPTLFQENPHLHTFARFVGSSLVIWFIWGNVVIEIMNPAFLFDSGDMGSYNARMNLKHLGFSLRFVTLLVEPFNPSRLEEPSRLFFAGKPGFSPGGCILVSLVGRNESDRFSFWNISPGLAILRYQNGIKPQLRPAD